jgi:hypothetical protein
MQLCDGEMRCSVLLQRTGCSGVLRLLLKADLSAADFHLATPKSCGSEFIRDWPIHPTHFHLM